MRFVKLLDGRDVSSESEDFRHECEARAVASMPTRDARRAHLAGVEKARGKLVADRLRATIMSLWRNAGNIGGSVSAEDAQ
mgnify:CR=1 FL=1